MPNLDVCGTIYPYPNVGDNPWGIPHINWATAVSNCLTNLDTQVQTQVMPNVFSSVGDLVYANATITPTRLGIGAIGQVLTVGLSGLPAWQTPSSGSVSVPVGSIISWNDFNGTLTLDPNYRYCDGSVIVAPGSPIDGQTTDDLSGAYIVGYGTLGAGDIGTVPWSASPVGNANHQIAINHTHSHTHTHPGPSHTHNYSGVIQIADWDSNSIGWANINDHIQTLTVQSGVGATALQKGSSWTGASGSVSVAYGGATTSSGSGNTGAASTPTTSSSLSATQNIQPRSQRYRFIIRVL